MHAAGILALWDAATRPQGRSARLLACAGEADPGRLSLGAATAGLVALRRRLLGPLVDGIAHCPACGTAHDVTFDSDALEGPVAPDSFVVEHEGWRATVRVPSLDDLDAAAACADAAAGAALLREAAILAVEGAGDTPPEGLLAAVEAALDAAEPLADARLAMECASCGMAWEVGFDAAHFLAVELGGLARREMVEIAALARAYGWSEAEILAIPPARRRVYRELAE